MSINTPKPDCVACTEAKKTVEFFDKHSKRDTEPGDLTHINLWGKYDTVSINGNQYFLLMVDDSSRFITIEFLRDKSKAAKRSKNTLPNLYLMTGNLKLYVLTGEKNFLM